MKISFTAIITAAVGTISFTTVQALASNPSLELKYFQARGAGETARIILALADEEYKDTRYEITPGTMESPLFKEAKESGTLDMNLGRAPLLIVNDESVIGQSKAIERYLSKKFGFMGSSDIEEAQIDCIAEHCRDIKDAQMKKGFSAFNRDKSDEEKATSRKEWFETDMPTMLSKLQKSVELTSWKEGYAVGDKTSYADIVIFSMLRDCTMQSDQVDILEAASGCETLLEIAERIASDSNVSKWVNDRPVTMF